MNRTDQLLKWDTFTEALSVMPESYTKLLDLHVPAANGRCRACTEGGTGVPHEPWPCAVHDVAARAQRIAQGRERGEQLRERSG